MSEDPKFIQMVDDPSDQPNIRKVKISHENICLSLQ